MAIPDNYDIWKAHQTRIEEEEERLPRCHRCNERITDDYLYHIDGEILCEECMKEEYRKDTEDFME